jgi:hypothetical protein
VRNARMNVGHGLAAMYYLARPIAVGDLNIESNAVSPEQNSVDGHAIDVYRHPLGSPVLSQQAQTDHARLTLPAAVPPSRQLMPSIRE